MHPRPTSERRFHGAEACPNCDGTGSFRGKSGYASGQCFKCDGTGRAGTRKERQATSLQLAQDWLAAHPREAKWLSTKAAEGNDFAQSLTSSLRDYGSLTARQETALFQAVARDDRKRLRGAAEGVD